jgi:hypothetical protein
VTAYSDIIEWAAGRPWWQQQALVRLASGEVPGAAEYEALADALVRPEPAAPSSGWLAGIQQPADTSSPSVTLTAIRDVSNVNRLAFGETLTFSPHGITVVYGHNGSGKSGYARLVKALVRTRHKEIVLPDIFSTGGGAQSACLDYEWNGQAHSVLLSDGAPSELQQVAFYDERCGELYVTKEGGALYRPSALGLLDGLIEVCDGVRKVLDGRISANAQRTVSLPALDPDTRAGKFMAGLRGGTDDRALSEHCTITDDVTERIEAAHAEESRLRATNPAKEAARLDQVAKAFTSVSAHLVELASHLGPEFEADLKDRRRIAAETRALADAAASSTFIDEPLNGVGTPSWRALWTAAEQYSEAAAYPGKNFPHIAEESHCVLCQQPLAEEARTRLERFQAMMVDTTEAEAKAAADRLRAKMRDLKAVQTERASVAVALKDIEAEDEGTHATVLAALETWRKRKDALLAGADAPAAPDAGLASQLATAGDLHALDARLVDADAFDDKINDLVMRQKELTASMSLAEVAEDVWAERNRRREEELLTAARKQTDTRGISRALGDLTSTHVTVVVQDRFSRESQDLQVDSVTLLGQGVKHGAVLHKPEFVGAAIKAELPRVLSEGEQTALGLAGFFVEAYLDRTKSALVLDDPVTSLDHLRRDAVADRLSRFARDRQVIVFTHDMAFAASLKKRADANGVAFNERTVERRVPDGQPGIVQQQHPWAIKDTKQRIHQLRTDLARIGKTAKNGELSGDAYDDAVSHWAGRLSQTWERIVSQEIADHLFDRSTLHVSVSMVKIAERITHQDNQELQQSFSRCSGWTRHDQDVTLNYAAPSLHDLETELNQMEAWYKRIVKYRTMK